MNEKVLPGFTCTNGSDCPPGPCVAPCHYLKKRVVSKKPKRWEYYVSVFSKDAFNYDLTQYLNHHAQDGWEYMHSIDRGPQPLFFLVFRKDVSEEDDSVQEGEHL